MDRRIAKTKKAIYDALLSLLDEKRYSKITIQEILDRANIGRSTFYSHFETKDDVLKAVCTDIFKHIFDASLSVESTHDFTINNKSPHLLITHILYHIKDNQKIIKGVLGSESGDIFMNFFKDYFKRQVIQILELSSIEFPANIPIDFLLNQIAASFLEMIRWWLDNGMKQTPEELTKYYVSITLPLLTSSNKN